MGNATLSYNFGTVSSAFKETKVYITGQNLFSITNYSGFDAEVNVDKSINGTPSLGIDHQAYPTARTLIIGLNFSL
jgi:iron complex outermembrane receptor protein